MSAHTTTTDTLMGAAPVHDDAAPVSAPVAHPDEGSGASPGLAPDVAPVTEKRALGLAEWGRGAAFLALFAVLFAGTAFAMAAFVALCHKLFKAAMTDQVLAAAWGNAVGTVFIIVLVFVMVLATLLTMGERKWSALMQDRMGPNRARLPIPGLQDKPLFGLPHIVADVLKMLTKEEIVPSAGNKIIFHLAPAMAFAPAFVLFAVIPMSPTFVFWGETIRLQVAALDTGLIYIFAIASIAVFGTTLAGWASNNKYALLGGIRASAQMISYEVTLGLTLVGLMIVFSTVRLEVMTTLQGQLLWGFLPAWGVLFQPMAIFAYFAAASAEIKRAPFDNPEGESEIVGYFIEYSGLKFGIFMISEFVEVVVFAGLFTTLFFGGWHLPFGEAWLAARLPEWGMGLVFTFSFIAKTALFCWLSLAVRWTFPRFRYDQVMDLGWKYLLPLSIGNVVLTGLAMLWGGVEGAAIYGLLQIAVLAVFVIGTYDNRRRGNETAFGTAPAAPEAAAHH
jgi:NADH-quinone oxidoreductase subunit H